MMKQKGEAVSISLKGIPVTWLERLCVLLAVCTGCENDNLRSVGDDLSGGAGGGHREFWVAGSTPEFKTTSDDGEDLVFEFAVGGTKLSDGSVVVADGMGSAVNFFSPGGHLRQVVGREGRGPGEFLGISWLGQCGDDSVFVWDRMLERTTVFDAMGTMVRQYEVQDNPDGVNSPTSLACSREGIQAVLGMPRVLPMTAAERANPLTGPLSVFDLTGASIVNVGDVPLGLSVPLGRLTRVAISEGLLYVGTAESAFVDTYTLDGRRVGAIGIAGSSERPATVTHYEKAIDVMLTALKDRDSRSAVRRRMLEQPMIVEYLPAYSALFTDPNNNLWVVLSVPGDTETVLRSFDPSGSLIGDLSIPLEMTVFEVGADYVLGSYIDDDSSLQHVVSIRYEPAVTSN